jgi:hypothetical protein
MMNKEIILRHARVSIGMRSSRVVDKKSPSFVDEI